MIDSLSASPFLEMPKVSFGSDSDSDHWLQSARSRVEMGELSQVVRKKSAWVICTSLVPLVPNLVHIVEVCRLPVPRAVQVLAIPVGDATILVNFALCSPHGLCAVMSKSILAE